MPLFPPQQFRKAEGIIRYGTAANRPAAGNVLIGTLYYSSDTFLLERSNGTSWDKLNPGSAGVSTTTSTGTVNDFNFSNASVVRLNNATDLTLTGLVAGYPGQEVVLISIGAGNVYLAHQNAGSSAANRIINTVTSISTPLAAGKGTAILRYDDTTARWRLVSHTQGAAISFAFNAGDYTTNGATETWTVDAGDVATWTYYIDGKIATVVGVFNTTTTGVAADATTLRIALPFTFTKISQNAGRRYIASIATGLLIWASADSNRINLFDLSFAAWPLETNGLYIFFEVPIEID